MATKRFKKLRSTRLQKLLSLFAVVVAFAAVGGIITLLMSSAATPITIDSTLPNPTNVRAWGDDRVITVSWDEPSNASSRNIVGYYITWGTGGTYTNAKQSTHTITQIQPVNNGTAYNIKVQSVQGSYTSVPTPGAYEGNNGQEARANGKVSTGATVTSTPSSARVDKLRSEMTGFFDDFNTPAGAFDELKWNHASSGCAETGSAGAFINNQFHSHNQLRSGWCDRAQIISRPRATFDITGKTEANPGVIVADFDGVAHGRDVWYIDLIPVDARKDGTPLDITSHASAFDDSAGDPKMLRMVQFFDKVHFIMYDNNKQPRYITPTYNCPDWESDFTSYEWCDIGNNPVAGMSPIPEPDLTNANGGPYRKFPVENVRQHWTIQISGTKIKLFINSEKVWEAPMPSDFVNVKKYTVHSTLFSYNTGKMDSDNPNTSLLHWDNFGFNGPASNIVTHNYLEGGVAGNIPYLGRGTQANEVPDSPRSIKVNIPDPIGTPVKARLMFTLNNFGYQYYTWSSNDHIMVNGKRYNFDNPGGNQQTPIASEWYGPAFGDSNIPYADSIEINAADLKQGMNDIALNINNNGIMNVHVELDYTNGTQPSYTQPKDIFGAAAFLAAVQPTMSSHDSYVFVEQNMGLQSGVISGTPASSDTTPPSVSITSPSNGANIQKSTSTPVAITADDNVGIDKVELYVDGALNTTITHSPFNHTLNTSNWSDGSHTLRARAFDAAGNSTQSSLITVNVTSPAPVDTSGPSVSVTAPTAGQTVSGTTTIVASASDPSGVTSVSFYLDGSNTATATDNSSPYEFQWNSASVSNGSHSVVARATDALGNTSNSSSTTFTVSNVTPDTTAPTTSITAPTNNTSVTGMVLVTVTASDAVGVSKVELLIDGVRVATDSLYPFSFSWNTMGYGVGTHTLRTWATDAANNVGQSSIVTVTIPDTSNPTASLTAPLNGATVSGTVNVSADANDNVGVSKVEFLLDGNIVATDTSPPFSFSWNTTSASNASHTLRARASDAAGNSGTSTQINVTVNNATQNPPSNPIPKTGDANGDGRVNGLDLSVVLINWRRSNASREQGDLNGDKTVNGLDLSIVLLNWGK